MSDTDRRELVSRLEGHALAEAAIEELLEQRDLYYKNLARTLVASGNPVDQRELDYKRGFWKGALWAFRGLPVKARIDLQKEIERVLEEKEGEDAGR